MHQKQYKISQLFSCFELRLSCDVAKDNHHLMKLAHLHRNLRKGLHKTSSGITNNAGDVPPASLQLLNSRNVLCNRFVGQKLPQEIFVTMWATKNHHAEHFSEVRCIHHDNDTADAQQARLNFRQINLLLHPTFASLQFLSNLFVGLFSMRI